MTEPDFVALARKTLDLLNLPFVERDERDIRQALRAALGLTTPPDFSQIARAIIDVFDSEWTLPPEALTDQYLMQIYGGENWLE